LPVSQNPEKLLLAFSGYRPSMGIKKAVYFISKYTAGNAVTLSGLEGRGLINYQIQT